MDITLFWGSLFSTAYVLPHSCMANPLTAPIRSVLVTSHLRLSHYLGVFHHYSAVITFNELLDILERMHTNWKKKKVTVKL